MHLFTNNRHLFSLANVLNASCFGLLFKLLYSSLDFPPFDCWKDTQLQDLNYNSCHLALLIVEVHVRNVGYKAAA